MSFCRELWPDAELLMLDPNSSQPPPPDVECRFPEGSHYLELAEIIQKNIAESSSPQHGAAILKRREPLARIWEAFWEILTKKLGKIYDPKARPRTLALYYYRLDSYWEFLRPVIAERSVEVRYAFLESGTFDQIFVFDARQCKVLFGFSTESFKVRN